jgi:hypothetical protein
MVNRLVDGAKKATKHVNLQIDFPETKSLDHFDPKGNKFDPNKQQKFY